MIHPIGPDVVERGILAAEIVDGDFHAELTQLWKHVILRPFQLSESRFGDIELQIAGTGGHHIIVPAPVAAQVVRDPRRQARLILTLRGCEIVPFEEDDVFPVGQLLAGSGTADVVDGLVALTAVKANAAIVTSDTDDMAHLLGTLGVRLPVLRP